MSISVPPSSCNTRCLFNRLHQAAYTTWIHSLRESNVCHRTSAACGCSAQSRSFIQSRTVLSRASDVNVPSSAMSYPAAEFEPPQDSHYSFACPICLTTELKVEKASSRFSQDLHCSRCDRSFSANETAVDLTPTSGADLKVFVQKLWGGTTLFRSPLVSFVYERGWRQGFSWGGFPGEAVEYEMAMDYLQSTFGGTIVDMSCGSGLFARRFARSGKFEAVVAADFSESMLAQAKLFFEEDKSIDPRKYVLLRADVGRLPFLTSSVAAIHAGAAIHCWPNPTAAVAEISRVLKPGGIFVASTFLKASAPLGQLFDNDNLFRPLNALDPTSAGSSPNYQWWEEQELRELTATMGLKNFQRHRSNRFIMFSVQKPL